MSGEDKKYPVLQAIASRVTQKQPDEIHLIAAAAHRWCDPARIELHRTSLLSLGFIDAGIHTVDVLPVVLQFMLKSSERMYSTIYEHPKAGIWINFVVLFEDDTSITFTSTPDRGMEQRPGHPIVHAAGATASRLYPIAVAQCPPSPRKPLSADSVVTEFEKAWVDGVRWRKTSGGISTMEVASVILSRGGQAKRILRPDRIHYLAGQDGVPERQLKSAFKKIFQEDSGVERAYLVYLRYDESPSGSVALCLVSTSREKKLLDDISAAFRAIFKKDQYLDIMFVSASEAPRIEAACPPFFTRK